MATPSAQQQDYFRSVSSESTTYMMVPAGGPTAAARRETPSKMWVAMVVIVVVVLQIASTTGLFVYLNMSISQVRAGFHSLKPFFPSFVCLYLEPHVVPVLARFTRKPLVRGPRWARNFQETDPMCVQIHSSASHAHSEYCCKAEKKKHTQTHTHQNLCTVFGVLQNK